MTDHANPRRYECNQGTKLWHLPAFVSPVLAPEEGLSGHFRKRTSGVKSGLQMQAGATS